MTRVRSALGVGSTLLLAAAAGAHPGHGQGGGSSELWHFLSEPVHVAFGVAVATAVALAAWIGRPAARRSAPSR